MDYNKFDSSRDTATNENNDLEDSTNDGPSVHKMKDQNEYEAVESDNNFSHIIQTKDAKRIREK